MTRREIIKALAIVIPAGAALGFAVAILCAGSTRQPARVTPITAAPAVTWIPR